jgi:hypothetical protein
VERLVSITNTIVSAVISRHYVRFLGVVFWGGECDAAMVGEGSVASIT